VAGGRQPVLEGFLDREASALRPGTQAGDGFRWDLLVDLEQRSGPDRLRAQYVRANVDPSDRYVQSLPGSGRHRIAPGSTGFANLAVAGDWTACGLDAGSLEAATRSGVLAARAVLSGAVRGRGAP
jgi:Flavin containing amine oxidoreductase